MTLYDRPQKRLTPQYKRRSDPGNKQKIYEQEQTRGENKKRSYINTLVTQ